MRIEIDNAPEVEALLICLKEGALISGYFVRGNKEYPNRVDGHFNNVPILEAKNIVKGMTKHDWLVIRSLKL